MGKQRRRKPRGSQAPAQVTKNQLAMARLQAGLQVRRDDRICGLLRTAFRCIALVLCAFFAFLMVEALAGKTTNAVLLAFLNIGIDRWVAYAVVGTAGIGYVHEKRQRKKIIERHASYIKKLEKAIDPSRSTSGLMLNGEPRKEDRNVA